MNNTFKTRLEQVLERHLDDREVALWGSPTRALLRVLRSYKFRVADVVDVKSITSLLSTKVI